MTTVLRRTRPYLLFIVLFLTTATTSCIDPVQKRILRAKTIAESAGFRGQHLPSQPISIQAFLKIQDPGKLLRIYLEGDGVAWVTRRVPSSNPTPQDPLALRLATQDTSANVVYLARPCQYVLDSNSPCHPALWTDKRFSEKIIGSINSAVDIVKKESRATAIELVGYSGGAAIAVVLAARRSDVKHLTTVAGNLDPPAVNRHHNVSPLKESLNPMDFADRIGGIPQLHLTGDRDKIISKDIAVHFIRRLPQQDLVQHRVINNTTHHKGWIENWRDILLLQLPPKATR